jgi:hypothetical protein
MKRRSWIAAAGVLAATFSPATAASDSPPASPGFTFGPQRELLVSAGAIAVAGEPESFVTAWIVDGESGQGDLWAASWERGVRRWAGPVDMGVDRDGTILIHAREGRFVLSWTADGTRRMTALSSDRSTGRLRPGAVHVVPSGLDVLALASRPRTEAGLLLVVRPASADAAGDSPSAVLALDAEGIEYESLFDLPARVEQAALNAEDDRITLLYRERESEDLFHAVLDEAGGVERFARLNSGPVTTIARPVIDRDGVAFFGWIERTAEQGTAMFGRVARDRIGSGLNTVPLSSIEGNAEAMFLGTPDGRMVAWWEALRNEGLYLAALSDDLTPVCESRLVGPSSSGTSRLLGDRGSGLLFLTRNDPERGAVLTFRSYACPAIDGAGSAAGGADSPFLGGAEDPCDGLDNDGDGTVDPGCDTVCDGAEPLGSDRRVSEASNAMSPAAVFTGLQYGIAWEDQRDGNREIYFARTDPSGVKLGPDLRVTNNAAESSNPTLVWTGSEYGLAWEDTRDGNREIYFTRIDTSGTEIGGDIRITIAGGDSVHPSLAWNGSEYGVAWEDARGGLPQIYFARLSFAGVKIGSDVQVTTGFTASSTPSLVWTGSEYGLAWNRATTVNDVYFVRLDSLGAPIGGETRVTDVAKRKDAPSLAWNGNGFGVAWTDYRNGLNTEIYLARLDALGTEIGDEKRVTDSTGGSLVPRLTWSGGEYGVAWGDSRDGNYEIYLARLDSSGIKSGADLRLTQDDAGSGSPVLIWGGERYAVVWHDDRLPGDGIYWKEVRCCDDADGDGYSECAGDSNDADATVNPAVQEACDGKDNDSDGELDETCAFCAAITDPGPDIPVTSDPAHSQQPSVAWTGSGVGIAWTDDRAGSEDVYFARYDAAGNQIGADVRITDAAGIANHPSLAWTGSGFGLAWQDGRDGGYEIYFAALDELGAKIGSDVRVTSAADLSVQPWLIWTGREFGVAWEDTRDGGNREIYFARLDAAGNRLGPDVRVTTDAVGSVEPRLAWNGSEYGLSWGNESGLLNVHFTRLNDRGEPVGTITDIGFDTAFGTGLAWNGTGWAVVWLDRASTPFVELTILDAQGSIVVPFQTIGRGHDPAMVWTGRAYAVAVRDTLVSVITVDPWDNVVWATTNISDAATGPRAPALAWTGSGFAVAWQDTPGTPAADVHLKLTDCCSDADQDRSCVAQDPNDDDPESFPGAAESCDGADNDGDGATDDGCDTSCDGPRRNAAELRVTNNLAVSDQPVLAWGRNAYGLAWRDTRDGNDEIYFQGTDPLGSASGGAVRVTQASGSSSLPDLAWTGTEYGLAWLDTRGGVGEIYFTRIDAAGNEIDDDVSVVTGALDVGKPSLAWSGSGYGIAWRETLDANGEIVFAPLDRYGRLTGPQARITTDPGASDDPSLVWNGSGYAVAWREDRKGTGEIYFARLDESGNKLAAELRVSEGGDDSSDPVLVWTGSEYGIAWRDYRDGNGEIYFARIDATGVKLGNDVRVTAEAADSAAPDLTWTGTHYGLGWSDARDGNQGIYFAALDLDGGVIGVEARVTTEASIATTPAIVWTGVDFGLAWRDARDGNPEIYLARVDCCDDRDGDGETECDDPNDADPSTYGGAPELCDGRDNDGDGALDEDPGCPTQCSSAEVPDDTVRIGETGLRVRHGSLVWDPGGEYGLAWNEWDIQTDVQTVYFTRYDCAREQLAAPIAVDNGVVPSLVWTGRATGIPFAAAYADWTVDHWDIRMSHDMSATSLVATTTIGDSQLSDFPEPSLVWTGTEFGVAWWDRTGGPGGDFDVYFARVDAAGNRIGDAVRVNEPASEQSKPSLVWTGTEYAVAWEDTREPYAVDIYFARLDAAGNKIGSDVLVTSHKPISSASSPSLVWSGDAFGLTWTEGLQAEFVRLAPDGTLLGPPQVVGSSMRFDLSLVWTGAEYTISGRGIYLTRLDRDGNVIEQDIDLEHGGGNTSLASNGYGYGIVFEDNLRLEFTTLDRFARNEWDRDRVSTSEPAAEPDLDWSGQSFGLAWRGGSATNAELSFDIVDPSGTDGPADIPLTGPDNDRSDSPSLVWNGSEHGVAWVDSRDGPAEVYFTRIDVDGTEIGDDVRLTREPSSHGADSERPSLAWTGAGWAVAWQDTRAGNEDIYFARLDEVGNRIGADRVIAADPSGAFTPDLIRVGDDFAVAWDDERHGGGAIYFARLNAAGTMIGSEVRVTTGGTDADHVPSLAWTGTEYGLAWRRHTATEVHVYFQRLGPTGSPIGSPTLVSPTATSEPFGEREDGPALAWTGGEYGIAWEEGGGTRFARLDSAGNVIPPSIPGGILLDFGAEPTLAWSGRDYALAMRYSEQYIRFARVRCINDLDGDGHLSCFDCDDADPAIPGAETCNLFDDDCDGLIDDGYPVPGPAGGLTIAADKQTLDWNVEAVADRYDVVKGDLAALHAGGGDYASSNPVCLEDDSPDTRASDPVHPLAGEKFYYLVRAQAVCRDGSYDSSGSGQAPGRDTGIDSSGAACP